MTAMLASVSSSWEARQVISAGADIVDLKDPSRGALGALSTTSVADIVNMIDGRKPTSATIGDLVAGPTTICRAVRAMSETGVDYVKVGLFAGMAEVSVVETLAEECARGTRVVIVLFGDRNPNVELLPLIAASGCTGVMLDTANKNSGSLRDCCAHAELAGFLCKARTLGLLAGLAGSLRYDDVLPLLELSPDYLGFRGALCRGPKRVSLIDRGKVQTIRTLISQHAVGRRQGGEALGSFI